MARRDLGNRASPVDRAHMKRPSVNRRMTLYPFAYFYGTRSQENGAEQVQIDFEPRFCRAIKYAVRVKTTAMAASS